MSWGGIRLWWESVETEDGRDLIRQPYSTGNTADVRDRGDVPSKPVRCSLLFDDFVGESTSAEERLQDLLLMKAKGKAQLFVHPIYGTYRAYIGALTHRIDSHGVITADAEFIADEDVGEVFAVDPLGTSIDVAVDTVDMRSAELSAELDAAELESDMPGEASAIGNAIDSAESARAVLVSVSSMSDRLWDEIDALQLAFDVATWPALKAYVMLGEAVRAAGDAALGDDAGAFMTVRIDAATSLRRLVTDIYGANEADDRYTEARELNDIRTPGSIPPGTSLRLRQPSARS